MKRRTRAFSIYLGCLFVFVSVGWLIWSIFGITVSRTLPFPIYLAIGILALLLGLKGSVLFIDHNQSVSTNWLVGLSAVLTLYAGAELGSVVHAIITDEPQEVSEDSGYGYFNGPCSTFDTIRGYRWNPGCHRTVKLNENTLVYDNTFCINNVGIYVGLNYQNSIAEGVPRRFVVLGDSFTAAEFLHTPQTNRLNQLSVDGTEYYSFALDGGGVLNWHSVFFKEVIPNYEFDGLIINVFGDDLKRDFFVMNHYPNQGYTAYLEGFPKTGIDFELDILPNASPFASYLANDSLNLAIECLKSRDKLTCIDLQVLKGILLSPVFLYSIFKGNIFLSSVLIDKEVDVSESDALEYYGVEKWRAINDIISFCKQKNIKVILSAVPYKHIVGLFNKNKVLKEKKYLELLVKKYDLRYFDGYKLFSSFSERELTDCYLSGDDHWSQYGSDVFTVALHEFLQGNKQAN